MSGCGTVAGEELERLLLLEEDPEELEEEKRQEEEEERSLLGEEEEERYRGWLWSGRKGIELLELTLLYIIPAICTRNLVLGIGLCIGNKTSDRLHTLGLRVWIGNRVKF